jgi:hypothetical protein
MDARWPKLPVSPFPHIKGIERAAPWRASSVWPHAMRVTNGCVATLPRREPSAIRLDPGFRLQETVMPLFHSRASAILIASLCVAFASGVRANDTPANPPPAEPATPEAVVDAQLAAYNQRDLEAFLGFYAEDAVLAKHPDQVTQTGKAEMRARYQRNFSNPNVRAEIIKRVTFGRFVVDHERITAPPAKGELEAVAVYEVKNGRIARVTFLEK